jgi:hypothetical protein
LEKQPTVLADQVVYGLLLLKSAALPPVCQGLAKIWAA